MRQLARTFGMTGLSLFTALAACSGERGASDAAPGIQSSARIDEAPADGSLSFPEDAPAGLEPSQPENISFDPLEIPETDFSRASSETEPNEDPEAASPLLEVSTSSDDVQFAARAQLSGRDTDYFSFAVEGEPQLYLIEAAGQGVDRVTLYEAAGPLAQARRHKDEARWTIASVYLAPGDYRVSVEHFREDGETGYTVRAVSLGAPDRNREREPNDDKTIAELIEPGVPRAGFFYEEDDADYYRFSLAAEQLVQLGVEPPPEVRIFFELYDGFRRVVTGSGDDLGVPVQYTALLQPGDYTLRLESSDGMSSAPYVVRLDPLNRFQPTVDLEPNDQPYQARPVPANRRIEGRAGEFGDSDWYRLPDVSIQTAVRIRSELGGRKVWRLRMYRWADGKKESVDLEWVSEDSVYQGSLSSGAPTLLEVDVDGEYALQLEFDPEPEWDGEARVAAGAELAGVTPEAPERPLAFAAFWPRSQRASIPLTVRNESGESLRLSLDAASSQPAWRVHVPATPLEIGSGKSADVTVAVEVAPNAPAGVPVRLDFRFRDEQGRIRTVSASAFGSCGAEPVNPGAIWTLPEQLVGGFNVAWSALGSRLVDAPDDSYGRYQPNLYDGLTPNDAGWYRHGPSYPLDLTVQLAGVGPVPVAGVILNPQGDIRPGVQVRDFEVYVSRDGSEFTRVLSGTLDRKRTAQPFVLEPPAEARFARLRVLSAYDPAEGRVGLGEFEVVSVPDADPFPDRRFNLADPALGGYVVWSRPAFSYYGEAEGILTESVEVPSLSVDPVQPTEWVVGFHHNRAAQIAELQWVDSPETSRRPRFGLVQISISRASPAGPWQPLGTWTLDRALGGPTPFVLPEPVWARFVRFVSSEAESAGEWEMAETLRILERASDAEYRSILAEWGQYSRAAVYEWMNESTSDASPARELARDNDKKGSALRMSAGTSYADQVERGSRIAWYRFDVPREHNRLQFALRGDPVANVSATLEDENGAPVTLDEMPVAGGELVLEAAVEGGRTYWLRVAEPVRHVVVAWDNSGSVAPYRPVIYRAITNFARGIEPGGEFVHLLPFRTAGFLLDDWSDQTQPLLLGLQSYPRKDDDSNAESYLLKASNALGVQEGAKAVILVTDAETFSYDKTPALWGSLARTRPRVFTVELHRGDGVSHQQDLMQSWADVNAGFYAPFRGQDDLDLAFERAFCHLRRPVRFQVAADSRYEDPPGPGLLAVEVENVIAANAVELILDASGSMLQRLEGERRIEIARTVLTDLVNQTLPEGTPLALRVFGHRKPDACDTDLALPLQPLERGKVTGVIRETQAMNLARTPIGESLRLVADDLKDAEGQKLIILITDGEETCDGDPAGAIRSLKDAGHDVRVNIVGFAIDDPVLKAEFEEWARLGGGRYFNATNAAELGAALRQALRPKFQVLDATGAVVADGTAGAEAVELPAGAYTVKLLTSPVQNFDDVKIEPEKTTTLSARGEG